MSHKNKDPLKIQAMYKFQELTCLGRSKYEDKLSASQKYNSLSSDEKSQISKQQYINNELRDKIYSYRTYATYEKHNNYFLDYCNKNYNCKTLSQCRPYVNEWLQSRIDAGLSAYTIKMESAGLGKLYQEPTSNFVDTPERVRGNITRSRGYASRDYGFDIKKNSEIINFCRGTGLRRSELSDLCKEQLKSTSDGYVLCITGKGGRYREAPIIGEHTQEIIDRIKNSGDKVWDKIPSHMDVHGYRSDYATAIYTAYKRDDIPVKEQYHLRGDRKGECMDKEAMLKASNALGHNRISVVAGHYIR